jgi:nucleoside-diphosphate-sugar epimerase
VTGANGLVESALCEFLELEMHQVIGAVRRTMTPLKIPVGDLTRDTNWDDARCSNIDSVVHMATQTILRLCVYK